MSGPNKAPNAGGRLEGAIDDALCLASLRCAPQVNRLPKEERATIDVGPDRRPISPEYGLALNPRLKGDRIVRNAVSMKDLAANQARRDRCGAEYQQLAEEATAMGFENDCHQAGCLYGPP